MNAALKDISDPVFPQLATAFDPEGMVGLVEKTLAPRGMSHDILSAKISDVNYDPGQRCNLLFEFKLRRKGGGRTRRQMMTVRLLKADERAPDEPDSAEVRRFQRAHGGLLPGPYFSVESARMVLCTFPFDPAMPWMTEALDTVRLKHRFSRLWAPERWKAVKMAVTLLGYTPNMRASMLYEIKRRHRDTGEEETVSLIGKTNAFKKIGKIYADSWALWESSDHKFPMPRPSGYLSAPRLTLQQKIAGERLGGLVEAPGFADRVLETAEALAFLHRLRFPVNARRRARDEVRSLLRWGEVVASIRADLRSRITPFLEQASSQLESRTLVQCGIHADFHHTNVLVDGDRTQIIDFDEMSYGDPAVDVGRFLASLRIPTLRTYGNIHELDGLREQFLETYLRSAPSEYSRIRLFESASLVTSAASAFRIQRPNWDEEVSLLLDEAERVFEEARRPAPVAPGCDTPPELPWEDRVRWARDPVYMQAMVERTIFDAYGVHVDGCAVLRTTESRNGIKARFKLSGELGRKRWRTVLRVSVTKRKRGYTSYRLLEQHYPLLEKHPEALKPPRPLAYLHRLSAAVTESCPGDGLKSITDRDELSTAAGRIGRALAAWHQAAAEGCSEAPEARAPGPARKHRSAAHARAADLVQQAEESLPPTDRLSVRLLHHIRLHELVLDDETVGLAGVHEVTLGDGWHDVAALVAAWKLEGILTEDHETSAAVIREFLRAYEERSGQSLESFAPYEALALAERACHLPAESPVMSPLLALAEKCLESI